MTRILSIIRSIPAQDLAVATLCALALWFVAAALSAILPGA